MAFLYNWDDGGVAEEVRYRNDMDGDEKDDEDDDVMDDDNNDYYFYNRCNSSQEEVVGVNIYCNHGNN